MQRRREQERSGCLSAMAERASESAAAAPTLAELPDSILVQALKQLAHLPDVRSCAAASRALRRAAVAVEADVTEVDATALGLLRTRTQMSRFRDDEDRGHEDFLLRFRHLHYEAAACAVRLPNLQTLDLRWQALPGAVPSSPRPSEPRPEGTNILPSLSKLGPKIDLDLKHPLEWSAVLRKLPKLAHVNLSRCTNLDDADVLHYLRGCASLVSVDVTFCVRVTYGAVVALHSELPNLRCVRRLPPWLCGVFHPWGEQHTYYADGSFVFSRDVLSKGAIQLQVPVQHSDHLQTELVYIDAPGPDGQPTAVMTDSLRVRRIEPEELEVPEGSEPPQELEALEDLHEQGREVLGEPTGAVVGEDMGQVMVAQSMDEGGRPRRALGQFPRVDPRRVPLGKTAAVQVALEPVRATDPTPVFGCLT